MADTQEEFVEPMRRPWAYVGEKQLVNLIKMNKAMLAAKEFPQELKKAAKNTQTQLMHEYVKRN